MLVEELRSKISQREFVGWQLYYKQFPWDWDQYQLAVIAMTMNNAWMRRKKSIDKFLPKKPRKSRRQMEVELTAFAHQHNARVRREKKCL